MTPKTRKDNTKRPMEESKHSDLLKSRVLKAG